MDLHVIVQRVDGITAKDIKPMKGFSMSVYVNKMQQKINTGMVKESRKGFVFSKEQMKFRVIDEDVITFTLNMNPDKNTREAIADIMIPVSACPEDRVANSKLTMKLHPDADVDEEIQDIHIYVRLHKNASNYKPFKCEVGKINRKLVDKLNEPKESEDDEDENGKKKNKKAELPIKLTIPEAIAANLTPDVPPDFRAAVEATIASAPEEFWVKFSDMEFIREGMIYYGVPNVPESFKAESAKTTK